MPPDTRFTRDEMRRLKRYAEAHGLKDEEEAHMQLSRDELARRYKIPTKRGAVLQFQALKSPRKR
jgi:hypothetical protein